jgi:hypothetical protein
MRRHGQRSVTGQLVSDQPVRCPERAWLMGEPDCDRLLSGNPLQGIPQANTPRASDTENAGIDAHKALSRLLEATALAPTVLGPIPRHQIVTRPQLDRSCSVVVSLASHIWRRVDELENPRTPLVRLVSTRIGVWRWVDRVENRRSTSSTASAFL